MLAVNHHSPDELVHVFGIILVLACLAGAGYLAYLRNALGALLLLFVAIVSAYLLL